MPEMIDEIKAIGEKIEEYGNAVTAAQEMATKADERMESMSEGQKKATEDAAKALESIQALEQKQGALEKTAEYIEKAVSRMGSGDGKDESKEMEQKASDQTARYLRTGQAFDAEVAENVVRALTVKSFHGIDDARREHEVKTLIAGVNPDGGYFIRPERSAQMIERIFETSPIRNHANVVTTSSDTLEMIIDDNEADSGGWVGEVTSRGNTDTPKIGLLTIPVHEQFAQPKATQKMLDDAGFDIESWLSGKVTRKMTRTENTAFVSGDGSQKPRGFLSLDAWAAAGTYQRNAIEQVNSGAAGAFKADGIKALQNSLIEDYQASAIFGIKRASFEQIITLKDGQGQYLLTPNFTDRDGMVLLGKQVVFMNDMPGVGNDELAMVYGDFSVGYTVVDRIGFRVIRDNITDKPNVLFYTTKRTGGDVTNYEALKIQKLAV